MRVVEPSFGRAAGQTNSFLYVKAVLFDEKRYYAQK